MVSVWAIGYLPRPPIARYLISRYASMLYFEPYRPQPRLLHAAEPGFRVRQPPGHLVRMSTATLACVGGIQYS